MGRAGKDIEFPPFQTWAWVVHPDLLGHTLAPFLCLAVLGGGCWEILSTCRGCWEILRPCEAAVSQVATQTLAMEGDGEAAVSQVLAVQA